MRLNMAFVMVLVLAGCASLKKDETVCPDYRDLRCLGDTDCTFDRARGCRVCRCSDNEVRVPKAEDAIPPR